MNDQDDEPHNWRHKMGFKAYHDFIEQIEADKKAKEEVALEEYYNSKYSK